MCFGMEPSKADCFVSICIETSAVLKRGFLAQAGPMTYAQDHIKLPPQTISKPEEDMFPQCEINPFISAAPVYIPGRTPADLLGRQAFLVVKMASNENPLGPSPKAIEAAQTALLRANLYPGTTALDLAARIANDIGYPIEPHNVLVTSGATEAIRLLFQTFLLPGRQLMTGSITFPLYRICAAQLGAVTRPIPMTDRYQLDLDRMLRAHKGETKVVMLCTPNNPTGLILDRVKIEYFLQQMPQNTLICIDESYRGFAAWGGIHQSDPCKYINDFRNVVIIRSFSKSAGLAGLRIGYVVASEEIIRVLSRATLPFQVGGVALAAAAASLTDRVYSQATRSWIEAERDYVLTGLDAIPGVRCLPTQANFVLIYDLPWTGDVCAELLEQQGFIVRSMESWGVHRAIRVSLGLRQQNRDFLHALARIMRG